MEENQTESSSTAGKSLLDQFNEATETKQESSLPNSGWSFDDEPAAEPDNHSTDEPAESKSGPGKKSKYSEQERQASAQVAVAMLDTALTGICTAVINHKHRKKFTETEFDRAVMIEDLPKEKVQDEDKALREKWDKYMAKRDRKIKNIEMKPDEIARHEKAFYTYFKIKDIVLPPEWLLYMDLFSTLGDRAIEVFAD